MANKVSLPNVSRLLFKRAYSTDTPVSEPLASGRAMEVSPMAGGNDRLVGFLH